MDLSLCVIAKNEAEHLGRCLRSAHGVADEIVVLDTGSTDETVAIAQSHGARVSHAVWENDFSKARNLAIEQASGAWILVLDADEELAPGWRDVLRATLATTQAAGFRVFIENLLPAGDVARFAEARSLRLFRNRSGYRYEHAIHEQIRGPIERLGGRVEDLELRIIHHGYVSAAAQGTSRVARNTAMLREAVSRHPREPWFHYHLGVTQKAAGSFRAARKHLREALALDKGTLDTDARARASCALAQIELAEGRNEAAATFARRALKSDPDSLPAMHVLALAMVLVGERHAATPLFEAVRRSPRCNPAQHADLDRMILWTAAVAR